MPAVKAKSKKKKDIQFAVSKNMQGLVTANKLKPKDEQRSMAQMAAISYAEAKPKKKKK